MSNCIACAGFPTEENNPCGLCGAVRAEMTDAISTPKVFIGLSESADFQDHTWTFCMNENYAVGAGRYAIMREEDYLALVEQANKTTKVGA